MGSKKNSQYVLGMFPYPSGSLHMGHVRNYVITDVIARIKAAQGYDVLYPMGWDSFGLPAENAARESGIHPKEWTSKNIVQMKKEMLALGLQHNNEKELITSEPSYYKHEQSFFIKLFLDGVAYKKESLVNWDPVDKTVLANEQVVNGCGWRSGAPVQQKKLSQWFLKISDYANELLSGLDTLYGWSTAVKNMQREWLGEDGKNLHDWCVSRQRYWGCPIPIIYCTTCGTVPEKEESLPVTLPNDVYFSVGDNPLDGHPTWKHTKCPKCGKDAIRDTDTFDTFVESSWYFAAFCSKDISMQAMPGLLPIDYYVGGVEHATMHLLYARYFTRLMYKYGYTDVKEPIVNLITIGTVTHETYKDLNGRWLTPEEAATTPKEEVTVGLPVKMSKSKKNTVSVAYALEKYGSDVVRMFVLSDNPIGKNITFSEYCLKSCRRFLKKILLFVKTIIPLESSRGKPHFENATFIEARIRVLNCECARAYRAIEYHKVIALLRKMYNVMSKLDFTRCNGVEEHLIIRYIEVMIAHLKPITPNIAIQLEEEIKKFNI